VAILVNHNVELDEKKKLRGSSVTECSKSYPLEVPVYHCLTVHMNQTPGDVFELVGEYVSGWRDKQRSKNLQAQTDSHPDAP